MKQSKQTLALALLLALSPAALADFNITNSTSTIGVSPIPDGDASGKISTITVPDLGIDSISKVEVILTGHGEFNGDLYAYLTHNGSTAVLLNRVGATTGNNFGYADAGFSSVRFSDSASSDIHFYQNSSPAIPLTGTWQPDGRLIDPASSGSAFDVAGRTTTLGGFNTMGAQGDWILFVADISGGGINWIDSWSLEISGVPEPSTIALGVMGGLAFIGTTLRCRFKNNR